MIARRMPFALAVWSIALALAAPAAAQQATPLYNTVKTKLREGKQVVGATILTPEPDVYCAVANSGVDFLWIEMQHSPLTYQDVARMILSCRGAPRSRSSGSRTRRRATSRRPRTSARSASSSRWWTT
jgi:hypothetical protein